MLIAKSYHEALSLYQKSVKLSSKWISQYYFDNSLKFRGVELESVQAFSQHYFFTYLLEQFPIRNIWSQYPEPGDFQNELFINKIIKLTIRIKNITLSLLSPQTKLALPSEPVDIIFLSSGKHILDQLPLIYYLSKKFKLLVIGKIPQSGQNQLQEKNIGFINVTAGIKFLNNIDRVKNVFFFLKKRWALKKESTFLNNHSWQSRFLYLRLVQFPEIKALIELADNIFKHAKPHIILTTSSNSTFGASFCFLARQMQIPVAELEHGFLAWAFDNAFLNIDYQLGWNKVFASVPPNITKKRVVVGCPYLQLPKYKSKDVLITDNRRIRILILWAPPFGSASLFKTMAHDQALETLISGLSKLPNKYGVVIRGHPSFKFKDNLKKIPSLQKIEFNNQESLEQALTRSNVVITQQTTAGFVAILYHKPLLFFDNSWLNEEFGHPFSISKSAISVPLNKLNGIDKYILEFINNPLELQSQRKAQEKFIREYCAYFGQDSCRQIEKFIRKILNERKTS